MEPATQVWIVLGSIFTTVTAIAVVVGLELEKRRRVGMRLVEDDDRSDAKAGDVPRVGVAIVDRLIKRIDDRMVTAHTEERRSKLRLELTQAGFLSADAPKIYFFAQAFAAVALPWIGYFAFATYGFEAGDMEPVYLIGFACLGYAAPLLFVTWRHAATAAVYRAVFPDFLDLLVVCVDAGLSLNAALERVSREFSAQCPALADNLAIFLSEVRSGRSITDGLDNLSVRLGIDEARSFSMLIKQSMELGSDVAQAMRVYSDDMRIKRLLRAETQAAKLPVKMMIPLGLCIFPVILITIITPAMINALDVMKQSGG